MANIYELDTPALLIDLDRVERNLERLADYSRTHRLRLRPHTKTHKLPELARMQVERGAVGITVAKAGEAEVMSAGGLDNILIAYPIVGAEKAARVAALAQARAVTVALDSPEAAESLSAAAHKASASLDILVEIDTGFHRCGVPPVASAAGELPAVKLARHVASLPGLRFAGIMFYPGHVKVRPAEQGPLLGAQNAILDETAQALDRAGLPWPIVSGGSTPSWANSHLMPLVNEIRPGTYIFNDRNTVYLEAASPEDCALTVLVTIVSTAVDRQLIVDGGSKTFSSDLHVAGHEYGYGEVQGRPDLLLKAMTEEHGHVAAPEGLRGLRVGERLRVVMNHACATTHLHERVYLHRGEEVVDCLRVAGRGKLQ